jgi:flagellar hook-length control protein FliK
LLKSLEAKFPSLSSSYGLSTSAIRGLLVNNFLVPGSVNASTVQAAFTLSGIFTEALWLSSRPGQGAQSSKTVLMILRQRITSALELGNLSSTERSALARLFSSVESAIASIAHQQIASIPQDDEKLKWTATLPLQQGEDLCEIDVDIERQPPRKDGGSPQWKLRLSLELQALGPVIVLIEMINDRLRIDFSVEESVNARMKEALPVLRNQLINAGLQLDNLSSKAFESVSDDVAKMSGSSRLDISI